MAQTISRWLCLGLLMLPAWLSAQVTNILVSEGFEGAFPGLWSRGDGNTNGPPAYWNAKNSSFGTVDVHSGSWKGYCAGIGYGGTTANSTYTNDMSAYMSRRIDLTGYTLPTLSFWHIIPSIETYYDSARVYIDNNLIWAMSNSVPAWTQVTLPLDAYAGATHTLKFEFDSDYSIVAEGWYLDDILVTAVAPPPPGNDNFANASTISGGSGSANGTTVGATKEPGEPSHAGNGGGASVWFRWVAPTDGVVTVNTFGSSFDTILGVYTGTNVSNLTVVTSDDDTPTNVQSSVMFAAAAGTEYRLAIDGYNGAWGPYTLSWRYPIAILSQPQDQAVMVGDAAAFSVMATGSPIFYQWLSNGVTVSGAVGTNFSLTSTSTNDSGSGFSVILSNAEGSVTSRVATLMVCPVVLSYAVSYQFCDSEAISPVVSYQYPDWTTISPVVSYQYYDWLDGLQLQYQTSGPVSSFYQGGATNGSFVFQGRVLDAQGQPVVQATVEARVMSVVVASAVTDANGQYVFPSLAAGTYVLTASKSGMVSDARAVALTAATATENFQLSPLPQTPVLAATNGTPPFTPPPDDAQGSVLCMFNGAAFSTNLTLDTSKMTIVLTHGWIPSEAPGTPPLAGGWPSILAAALNSQNITSVANIVAWDWHGVATAWLSPEEATPSQGIALGEALQQALGTNYAQKVHFIGHSLGTLVNGYAVDYLHRHQRSNHRVAAQPWLPTNTHVTMFDEASIARVISKETLAAYIFTHKVAQDWKDPVPNDFRWLDNYIASVGRYHPEAVNVLLQKGMLNALANHSCFVAPVEAHGYPMTWYSQSVTWSNRVMPGFGTSFEYAALHPGLDFPPTSAQFGSASSFDQSDGDEMALEPILNSDPRLYFPAVSMNTGTCADLVTISDWVETEVDQAASVGRRIGNVIGDVAQDIAVDAKEEVNQMVNGTVDAVRDLVNHPGITMWIQTGPASGFKGDLQAKDSQSATNTAAAVWLPVAFPTNASLLAFDFVLQGDGKNDALVFGINGSNLFTLATKYIPVGVTNTSRFVDVSAWAGTTSELFFGLLGGTSTNCSVQVQRIRFFAFAPPALAITAHTHGATALSWPSTASGCVLESTADLNDGPWNAVTNTPALFGGRFTVTNQWSEQTRFFRLRRPQ